MKNFDKKELNKIIILGLLLIFCFFLTYYFQFILRTEIVFTHLFYIPIILAGLWWARKGVIIAVSLAVMLLFINLVDPTDVPIYLDLVRASMFIVVSIIIGVLSEKRYLLESKLQVYSKNLEEQVEERTAALRESRYLLEKIINSNPDWIFAKDKNYRYMLVNDSYASGIGKLAEDLIGKNDIEVGFPKELIFGNPDKGITGFRSDDKRVLEGETIHNEYDPATSTDGALHIFDTYKIPLRDSNGNIYAVLGYARDITERKKAEKDLTESEERYRTVFENTGTATVVIEEDMHISMANTQFEKLSGYPKKEIENKMKWADFVVPEDLERMKKFHTNRRKTGEKPPTEYEFCFMDKKGNIKDIFLKIAMISNTKKSIASLTDITRHKQAEERIEKIQSLRNAISDINQLLVRVKNESELFQRICNLIIKVEEIKFVWIGLTNSENFKVKPVAQAGFEEGYLSSIKITWDDSKYGNGPTGIALKTLQPFIMRNIEDDPKFKPWENDALKRGYLSSIALPLIYKKEPIGTLNVYSGIKDAFTNEKVKFLKEVSEDITIGIRSLRLEEELRQSYQQLTKTMDTTIDTMSSIIEAKDPYTAGHQRRVSQLTTAIAKELNLSQDNVKGIKVASLIHDIGKIAIPTEILSKPIKLSDIEFSLIKEHSQIGYDILKSIDFSYPVANIVLQHHERLNGSGYPQGIEGDNILLEAKILGVADVVEAMSSHRPYRPALGIDKALEEITQNKGVLYDPEIVDVCLRLFKEKEFKFE